MEQLKLQSQESNFRQEKTIEKIIPEQNLQDGDITSKEEPTKKISVELYESRMETMRRQLEKLHKSFRNINNHEKEEVCLKKRNNMLQSAGELKLYFDEGYQLFKKAGYEDSFQLDQFRLIACSQLGEDLACVVYQLLEYEDFEAAKTAFLLLECQLIENAEEGYSEFNDDIVAGTERLIKELNFSETEKIELKIIQNSFEKYNSQSYEKCKKLLNEDHLEILNKEYEQFTNIFKEARLENQDNKVEQV